MRGSCGLGLIACRISDLACSKTRPLGFFPRLLRQPHQRPAAHGEIDGVRVLGAGSPSKRLALPRTPHNGKFGLIASPASLSGSILSGPPRDVRRNPRPVWSRLRPSASPLCQGAAPGDACGCRRRRRNPSSQRTTHHHTRLAGPDIAAGNISAQLTNSNPGAVKNASKKSSKGPTSPTATQHLRPPRDTAAFAPLAVSR